MLDGAVDRDDGFGVLAHDLPPVDPPASVNQWWLATAPADKYYALTDIPALNSNPGAPATLYLDFNGHFESTWGGYSNVSTPVFDVDGDATTFSSTELSTITDIWKRVSEDYAPFRINVSTVDPGNFADGVALRASIGGNGSWIGNYGGVAYVNSFTNYLANTVYVFSDNLGHGFAKYVAEAAAHEAGHGFGLSHQSTYDGAGAKTNEYNPGNTNWAPVMGVSYYAARSTWYNGTSTSASTYQDDLTVLARSANGFGYRADDHGNTVSTATPLSVVSNQATGAGVLTTTSDVDYFSFSTGAGQVSFTLNVAEMGANLDARLELRRANGELIAAADPSGSLTATVTATVSAGDYRLAVSSHGTYGDVGQYSLSGTVQTQVMDNATLPYSDSFDRANSTVLGTTWSEQQGDFSIVSNRAGAAMNADSIATLNGISQADVRLTADVAVGSGHHAGLVARYSGSGDRNMYMGALVNIGGGQYRADIWRNLAGTWSLLASQPVASGTGTLRFDVLGGTLRLYFNDVLAASAYDTTLTTGTVGMRGRNGATLDNFAASVLTAPPVQNAALPYSEAFTGATGAALAATWTQEVGNFALSANEAAAAMNVDSVATLNGISEADVSVSADVNVVGAHHAALVARYSGAGDQNMYMGALVNGGGQYRADIWRNVAGTWTQLASEAVAAGAGTLRFEVVGASLALYLNDALVASTHDSALTGGSVGIRGRNGATFDNFAASALPAAVVQNVTLPFSDNFNRANNIDLGATWSERQGDFTVANNRLISSMNIDSIAVVNGIVQANVRVTADVNVAGGHHLGLLARYSGPGDANAYMGALVNYGGVYKADIWRNLSGVWTQLASQTVGSGSGTLRFEAVGSALRLYLNDTLVAAASDSTLTTGSVGIRGRNGTTVDNFAASDLSSQSATSAVLPFTDAFTRADNTFLGATWTEQQGDFSVVGNRAATALNTDSVASLNGVSAANVSVSADVNVVGAHHAGLLARYSGLGDKNTYMGALVNNGGTYSADIFRNVGGAWTRLASQTVGSGSGTLRFDVVGTSLKLYLNNALVASATDSALSIGTVGMRGRNGATFDNFAASAQTNPNGVAIVLNNLDGPNEGFNDPTLGAARRAAFQSALDIWSSVLVAAYAGETITVDAQMDPMGGSATSAILGGSSPNYVWTINRPAGPTWYADALANHLSGHDLDTAAEIVITFNSDVDNSTVLGNTDWYYGLDGNAGSDIDFVTVVAHEIGHGLNFLDLVNQDGSWFAQNQPGVYDRLLENSAGTDLVAMTQAQRAAAITSNALYWNGAYGAQGNSGARPKLYAPTTYEPGSSVSHLDETVHKYELMSPYYSGVDHSPSAMELGMLRDMGWQIAGMASPTAGLVASAGRFDVLGGMSLLGPGQASRFQWSTYSLPSNGTSSAGLAQAGDLRFSAGDRPGEPAGLDASPLRLEAARSEVLQSQSVGATSGKLAANQPARRVAAAVDLIAESGVAHAKAAMDEGLLNDLALAVAGWGERPA